MPLRRRAQRRTNRVPNTCAEKRTKRKRGKEEVRKKGEAGKKDEAQKKEEPRIDGPDRSQRRAASRERKAA